MIEISCTDWKSAKPESVDVIITDPPYADKQAKTIRSRGRNVATGFGGLSDSDIEANVAAWLKIARRWIVVFCAWEQIGVYAKAAGPHWIRCGAWIKQNPAPQFSGDRPATFGEAIGIMHRSGKKRWAGGGHPALFVRGIERDDIRIHPTQKPVSLMIDLLNYFSEPWELVWDPYCGSGSTGVACARLDRHFLGHERNITHYKIACERIAAAHRHINVIDARKGQASLLGLMEQ